MKDLIYYYDKTTFQKNELGEIQNGFNQSFVVDGTKDSSKVEVLSFNGKSIEPNTIIFHRATQTWWIVSHDKVERYEYESSPLYLHNLQLEGAIELLNARDLTDNGFNDNRYNVDTFITRLFALSTFEFNHTYFNGYLSNPTLFINYKNNIAQTKVVDYIKTFENYTLLSALREFLDGYNCSAKLEFIESSSVLVGARLIIVSKTGNSNELPIYADQIFKDPRETKNMDKNNFGTSVVSNAENVVSTKAKTYPSVGGVRFSSEQYKIDPDNAIIRLPSNIFKVNLLKIHKDDIPVSILSYNTTYPQPNVFTAYRYNSADVSSMEKAISKLVERLQSISAPQEIINQVEKLNINELANFGDLTLKYTDNYNPSTGKFIYDYQAITYKFYVSSSTTIDKELILSNNETRDNVEYPDEVIYYKRGDNLIKGFTFLQANKDAGASVVGYKINVDIDRDPRVLFSWSVGNDEYRIVIGQFHPAPSGAIVNEKQRYNFKNSSVSVNYIPMSDIKIKYDNDGDTIDTNLYNQNGKLNDSNALSKVLLSHSKEIESDTITRFGTFYGKYNSNGFSSSLPSVGDLVYINQDYYVINNISLDFQPNENINDNEMGYYITAEVSMSKKVATKSMLTNPNTNIRDYGIPQNNNVKRKQLYRDFYELSYKHDNTSTTNWYLPLSKILNLSNTFENYQEHIALIKTTFSENVNNRKDYYYQLETTTYFMKKAVYEIVDFKDNNIIGYGSQNLWSGFDLGRTLNGDGWKDLYNTPISYVDETGEIKSIDIKLSTIDNVVDAYNNYNSYDTTKVYNVGDIVIVDGTMYECNTNGTTGTWDSSKWEEVYTTQEVSIYNANVFIPQEIYDYLIGNKVDILIEESNYLKDALEVPVFEYSAQIDDTNDVVVGENILDRGNNDVAYLYSYVLTFDNGYDDNNYMNLAQYIEDIDVNVQNQASHNKAVRFDYTHINDTTNPYFTIKLYESETIDVDDNEVVSLGNEIPLSDWFDSDMALLVIRHNLTSEDLYTNIVGELATNEPQQNLPTASSTYRNKIIVTNDGNYYICTPDQYSCSLSFGSNCYGKLTLIREGNYIFNELTIESGETRTFTALEDDYYSWSAYADTGYYIVGVDSETGTIHDSGFTKSVTSLHYQTISFTKNAGVTSIELTINGTSRTLTSNENIDNLKQADTYSFTTTFETGFEEQSGGSQSTTAIGNNPNNVLSISPIAQRIKVVLSVSISGGGSGSVEFTYKDPDTQVETTVTLNNYSSLYLKYGTEYVWEAVASSGSYTSGNAGGHGIVGLNDIDIITSFELLKSFSLNVLADSHTFARYKIKRGSFVLHEGNVIPNTTETFSDLRPNDTYEIEVLPWGTLYYIPSTETTYYSGSIGNGVSIQTTAVALRYRTISIYWAQGLLSITITKSGGTPQTYENPNPYGTPSSIPTVVDSEVEQGLSYSYTTSVADGFMAISGASGSWNSSTGDWDIKPDVVITPTINQVTLGNLYEQPTSNSWKSILTVYPNFMFSSPIDRSLISSIVVKMYIYYGPGSGQVIESYTKTYYTNDLSVNSSSWLYASNLMYTPIIDWNGTSLSGRGAWVGNAVSQSSNTCKIEVTVNYANGQSRTKSIGGTSSFLVRTSGSGFYLAHFAGQTSLKYRAQGWGNDSFDQGENSIARWYTLS